MKIYFGKRLQPEQGTAGNVKIWIEDKKQGIENGRLRHHVYHSPTGHNWGYGGSGPAELAKDILWDYFGKEPTSELYQQFKWDFVAKFKDEWQVSEMGIDNWIIGTYGKERLDFLKGLIKQD